MITYNQGKYIKNAIEGVLMQKTNFDFELIIGEDCSSDNTNSICVEYVEKYPDKIRLISYSENQGMIKNFIRVLEESKGRYIAFCEGDDYWIDPFKLQKQFDFLENNSSYGLIYTGVFIQEGEKRTFWEHRDISDCFDELIVENHIPTLSVCCRSSYVYDFLSLFKTRMDKWPFADFPLWLYISSLSLIKYIPDMTGVYRILSGSVSHPNDIHRQISFQRECCRVTFLMKEELIPFKVSKYYKDNEYIFIKKYYSWMVSIGDCKLINKSLSFLFKEKYIMLLFKCILLLSFYKFPTLPIYIVRLKNVLRIA